MKKLLSLFIFFFVLVAAGGAKATSDSATLPDLIISDVKLDPAEPIADFFHPAKLIFAISNQGNGIAINTPSNKMFPVVYPGESSFFYPTESSNGCASAAELPPGSSCYVSYEISFLPTSSGTQKMVIEISGGITEQDSNKDNNKYIHTFTIATVKNIPNYKLTISPDKIKRGETYNFKVEINNAKPNSKIFFNLRRPDKSVKYDNYDTGQYTDANGFWSGDVNQYVTVEGKNGEWESFVAVGGITSNALYHNVVSSQLLLNIPYIAVSSPNGGEVLSINSKQKIKWQSSNVNNVRLHLTNKYGGVLAADLEHIIGNPGEITSWIVPNVPVGDYRLKIVGCTEEDYNCSEDLSDSTFSIVASDYFSVSELSEGTVVKSPSDPTVYVIKDGKRIKINSPQEFEQQGYKWDQVKEIQSDLLAQISELKDEVKKLREELARAGVLLKAKGSDDVYVVDKDGQRSRVRSPEEFNQRGYKWDQIQEVTSDELASIPTITSDIVPSSSEASAYPNGTLIKAENDPTIYIVINGKKRSVPDPATFNNWGLKWDQVKEVPSAKTSEFEDIEISSDLVRAQGDKKIYRIIGDKKLWIPTIQAFLGSGYKPNTEIEVSQDDIADFENVKYIKLRGGRYVYEIRDNKKYRITNIANIPEQDIKSVTLAEFTAYPIGR